MCIFSANFSVIIEYKFLWMHQDEIIEHFLTQSCRQHYNVDFFWRSRWLQWFQMLFMMSLYLLYNVLLT